MVTEISAKVCSCQSRNPLELKMPSTESALENTPAVVSLYRTAISPFCARLQRALRE